MIRRTVREWNYLEVEEPAPGAFTRQHADRIVSVATAIRNSGFEGENILINHPRRLRAQQIVGIVAADDVVLEILPKIDGDESDAEARKALVHMLAVVLDLDIAEGAVTELGWQNENLLEILIRLFCDRLFEAVHRGLPRRYVEQEDDLSALRGRLNAVRQFTVLAASPQRLACRFDELSADIPLNQIMKAAVGKLQQLSRAIDNQRRLAELALAFADVRAVPIASLAWDRVVIDRTNRAWGELVSLAKLLLGERFQTTSSGSQNGFALLFEMNSLFEEFTGRMLQRALSGTPFEVRLQGPRDHALLDLATQTKRFATKPDITVRFGGKTLLILDTKWKRLKGAVDDPKRGVGQSDIYQMMAYAHVYCASRLVLLYPHHGELSDEEGMLCEHLISGTQDTRIAVATLALTSPRLAPQKLSDLLLPRLYELAQMDSFAA